MRNHVQKILSGLLLWGLLAGPPSASLFAAPPDLAVIGNKIMTVGGGCTIRFKGVNVDGMEFDSTGNQGPPGQGITATVAEAVTAWNSNLIRLPLNQDWWFGCGGGGAAGASYRTVVDNIVNYCLAQNVYVLLDLHWSGKQTGATAPCGGGGWGSDSISKQQNMPDDNSVTFWSSVAARYANNPVVLFDLYNEPHDEAWTTWRNGGTSGSGFHTPGLQTLLTAIRATGANNVVVAGGLDWAYDLRGMVNNYCGGTCALTDTVNGHGVIYAAHIYPWKGNNPWIPANGDGQITVAAATYPILIGEFGQNNGSPDTNGTWDSVLLAWMDLHQYSGTAWDMHTSSSPILISDWGFTPTAWHGVPVKDWLSTPIPPCATATFTATPTPTHTSTPCVVFGNTCTPTLTPTPTFTVTFTPTPSNLYVVYPNPWPDPASPGDTLSFYYQNDQAVDQVKLKIFTLAYRKVYEDDNLPTGQGPQPPWSLNTTQLNLANGLYYFVVVWKNGSRETQRIMKVLIRR